VYVKACKKSQSSEEMVRTHKLLEKKFKEGIKENAIKNIKKKKEKRQTK